jgi:hypothetical protein
MIAPVEMGDPLAGVVDVLDAAAAETDEAMTVETEGM